MNRINKIVILILVHFCVFACNKNKLPRVTQKGANTFGCKIDGVVFKPYFTGGLFNNVNVLSVGNALNYNIFGLNAENQETSQSVSIEFTYLTQTGTYKLRQYPYRGVYDAGYRDPGWYTTDSVNTGELVITRCDNTNKIYSGTFSFTCKDVTTGRIVKITDGRFDVKE